MMFDWLKTKPAAESMTLAQRLERDMKSDPELAESVQAIRDFCKPNTKPNQSEGEAP